MKKERAKKVEERGDGEVREDGGGREKERQQYEEGWGEK
jgi:hypothetical protein